MASVREPSAEGGERADRATALPERIVFFDGLCGLCDRSVQLLLARDRHQHLHFAPLQGETARDLRTAYPKEFPQGVESLVYCDNTGARPRFFTRSGASFAIAREVESLRGWAWLSVVPRPLTDLGYRALAASRYALFGRLETCRVPRPEDVGRFLA
jgi:predicted DCC family thiol-disulfide oxidoreductase YuxK